MSKSNMKPAKLVFKTNNRVTYNTMADVHNSYQTLVGALSSVKYPVALVEARYIVEECGGVATRLLLIRE